MQSASSRAAMSNRGSFVITKASMSATVFAAVKLLARQHLEQHHAEGPDVRPSSAGLPWACSGDMYAAVPRIVPAIVAAIESVGELLMSHRRRVVQQPSPGRNRAP